MRIVIVALLACYCAYRAGVAHGKIIALRERVFLAEQK